MRTYLPIFVPIAYSGISSFVFMLAINTIQCHRIFWLPFSLIPACLSFSTSTNSPEDWDSLWGLFICIWVLHSTSVLYLEKSTIADDVTQLTLSERFTRARKLWNNPRLLNTTFHPSRRASPEHTPSLPRFALHRLGKLLTYYTLVTHIQPRLFPGLFLPLHLDEFSPLHETYFRRLLSLHPTTSSPPGPVTSRETELRAIFALYWAWGAIAMLDTAHSILSLIFVVSSRLDSPAEWPPSFGSSADAHSVRRFWARFWHRSGVPACLSYARLCSRASSRLRSGGRAERIFCIAGVFFLSGVMHAAVGWWTGDRCGWPRDVWWFCVNFGAGAVEAVGLGWVDALARRIGWQGRLWRFRASRAGKAVGFAWVFSFLFWSVPKWQYPKLYCRIQDIMTETGRHV